MYFPETRLRRLRRSEQRRRMVKETSLSVNDLIYPLLAIHGKKVKKEVPSMPGVFQLSIENLVKEAKKANAYGVGAVLLFGIPEEKDPLGTDAYSGDGIVQRAVSALKEELPDLVVITDVCMCEYTDHGHCGVLDEDGNVNNDATLDLLAKSALSHVKAGADMVAPSDMMDGRVMSIRDALDDEGFFHIPIMSYAAKYASAFYGPFREAAESTPQFGDRRSYQMDPPNVREAIREISLDVEEGADIVMVKPALSYLDVISIVKDRFDVPVAAYNVSGEYSLVKAAALKGWIDEERIVMEILTGIKRAGADLIITYFAKDVAKALGGM
jgi:porphobilinogen synthase